MRARVPVIAKMNVEVRADRLALHQYEHRHDGVRYTNLDALACGMVVVHVYLGALLVHTD